MIYSKFLFHSALCIAFSAFASQALAQAIPSAADAVNAQRSVQQNDAPKAQKSTVNVPIPAPLNPKIANEEFTLNHITITGSTLYPAGTFDGIFAELIGKTTTINAIQITASKITQHYFADGYVLATAFVANTELPKNGKITVKVVEGKIGTIEFQGMQPSETLQNLIKTYAQKIKDGVPVRNTTLERYLLLMNDVSGTFVRAVLRPSKTEPDTTDLFLNYSHRPWDVYLNTDNRSSRFIGVWQHSATLNLHNPLGLDERISLRGIVSSPTTEMRFGDVQYEQPIGAEGTKILFGGSWVKSAPGDFIKNLNVRSESFSGSAKLTHPLIRSRTENLNLNAQFDLRNSESYINVLTKQNADRVRNARFGAAYDIADDYDGVNLFDFKVSQGLSGLGASENGAGRSRNIGKQGYTKLELDLSRTQALPSDFSLFMTGNSQYAFNPLLSSEQFTLGGSSFGGGYDPGEIAGDSGVAAKIELRFSQSLNDPFINYFQLFSYYDVGAIWREKTVGNEQQKQSLASMGFGTRLYFANNFSGNVEVAFPLTKDYSADPGNNARLLGGLSRSF